MKIRTLLIPAMLLFCGCSTDGESPMSLLPQAVTFEVENIEISGAVSKVNCYVFQEGVFRQAQTDIPVKADGSATIQLEAMASNVYFVTNINSPKAYSSLVKGVTTEAEFKQKATDLDATHSSWQAPEFHTGFYALNASGTISPKVKLSIGQSRIDVDASSDLKIKVTKISVEKAPANTFVFPNSAKLTQTKEQSYVRELKDPTSGIVTDALRLYESDEPITVFVWGLYNDKPIAVKATIEKIDRGKIYTLKLRNGGISVEGVFEIEEWLPGGQVDAKPDANAKITIEPTCTTIPSDVTLNASNTAVSIPHTGTSTLVLGFAAEDMIEIDRIDGATSDVDIAPAVVTSSADGKVITRYAVTINAQGAGRLPYGVVLHVKHSLRQYSYDVVTLNVAPHPTQIETVEMCGNTWMAFNARSSRLDEQIYVLDGMTVKQMYEENWISTIGGLFQWGRLYMYVPWEKHVNNAGNQKTDVPWTAITHMPCPEGYRVPTVAELQMLLPHGVTISSYETNTFVYTSKTGEEDVIEVDLRKAEKPASINGVTGPARYITLRSQNTGAVMYIPLSGEKGDKAQTNNPSFGQGFSLWSNSSDGATNGWAWRVRYWPGGTQTGTIGSTNNQLQAEGYAYVRCIKK